MRGNPPQQGMLSFLPSDWIPLVRSNKEVRPPHPGLLTAETMLPTFRPGFLPHRGFITSPTTGQLLPTSPGLPMLWLRRLCRQTDMQGNPSSTAGEDIQTETAGRKGSHPHKQGIEWWSDRHWIESRSGGGNKPLPTPLDGGSSLPPFPGHAMHPANGCYPSDQPGIGCFTDLRDKPPIPIGLSPSSQRRECWHSTNSGRNAIRLTRQPCRQAGRDLLPTIGFNAGTTHTGHAI